MLDEENKKRVKHLFNEYLDLLDNRKEINDQIKEAISQVAEITNVKKSIISKTFSFLRKKHDDGIDELEDITVLVDDIE
jgi:hypothetical protein